MKRNRGAGFGTSSPPRPWSRAMPVLGLVILSMTLLSGCDWLTDDGLPSWLSRAEASSDLAAAISGATGSTMRYSPEVSGLVAAGRVLCRFMTMDGHTRLFVLDGTTLTLERGFDEKDAVIRGNFGWGVDALGRPVAGDSIGAVALDPANAPLLLPSGGDGYYCSESGVNYVVQANATGISVTAYSSAWSTQTMAPHPLAFSTLSPDSFKVADFGIGAAGPRILIEDIASGSWFVVGWASMGDLLGSSSLIEGAALKTPAIAMADQSPVSPGFWTCADGMIYAAKPASGEGVDLVHLGFDRGKATFRLDRSWDVSVDFGPASASWFFYDSEKGLLVKVRPWW